MEIPLDVLTKLPTARRREGDGWTFSLQKAQLRSAEPLTKIAHILCLRVFDCEYCKPMELENLIMVAFYLEIQYNTLQISGKYAGWHS